MDLKQLKTRGALCAFGLIIWTFFFALLRGAGISSNSGVTTHMTIIAFLLIILFWIGVLFLKSKGLRIASCVIAVFLMILSMASSFGFTNQDNQRFVILRDDGTVAADETSNVKSINLFFSPFTSHVIPYHDTLNYTVAALKGQIAITAQLRAPSSVIYNEYGAGQNLRSRLDTLIQVASQKTVQKDGQSPNALLDEFTNNLPILETIRWEVFYEGTIIYRGGDYVPRLNERGV